MLTAITDCCDLTTSAISVHTQDTAKANKAQPRRRWRKPRITPRVIVTTEAGAPGSSLAVPPLDACRVVKVSGSKNVRRPTTGTQ